MDKAAVSSSLPELQKMLADARRDHRLEEAELELAIAAAKLNYARTIFEALFTPGADLASTLEGSREKWALISK